MVEIMVDGDGEGEHDNGNNKNDSISCYDGCHLLIMGWALF